MGTTVYNTGEEIRECAHVFAHSRRDGKEGVAYFVINNYETDAIIVELPKAAEVYKLTADKVRATVMRLNGKELILGANNDKIILIKKHLKQKCLRCFFVWKIIKEIS